MDIIIYGAGGLGREIYDTILSINSIENKFHILGYVDDSLENGIVVNNLPVLGGSVVLDKIDKNVGIILGFADPNIRKMMHLKYKSLHPFPNIIHPTAIISSFAEIKEAVLIQSNCVVAANAKIGNGVMMNAHSGIGHDTNVSDYCSIMSFCDLAGNSNLGTLSFIGSGAKIIPSISIAAESYVCAGSVVFKSVVSKSKLMGNPAKIIG
jgi:sugar O-acyltransferase (sialic acid O-acetyltransferase NeuD family)